MVAFLQKQFKRLKKILPIPSFLSLLTAFFLKIGYLINSTRSWIITSGLKEKAIEILANIHSWLASHGVIDAVSHFLTNTKAWLDTSGITEKMIQFGTKLASYLPKDFIPQAMAFGKELWLNAKHYLRTNLPNHTTALIAGGVFLGTALLVALKVARDEFKDTAFYGYFARLKNEQKNPGTQPLTDDEIAVFNIGKDVDNSLFSRFKSCFNPTAILNPTAYFSGRKFASMPQNDKESKAFTNLMTSNIDFSNKVKEYKLLSQEEKDKALYVFEKAGCFANKLTSKERQEAAALLIAGANPNYFPTQNEYRNKHSEPCSLIASAINSADLKFFNLLLKYDADIFQESKSSNQVVWRGITRTFMHPSNVTPEYTAIADKIAVELGTTPEKIRENISARTNIEKISLPEFVEQMKAKSGASLKV